MTQSNRTMTCPSCNFDLAACICERLERRSYDESNTVAVVFLVVRLRGGGIPSAQNKDSLGRWIFARLG